MTPRGAMMSRHDWDRLSIGGDHQGFFPASPLREPFHSLLMRDPATGLALISALIALRPNSAAMIGGRFFAKATIPALFRLRASSTASGGGDEAWRARSSPAWRWGFPIWRPGCVRLGIGWWI